MGIPQQQVFCSGGVAIEYAFIRWRRRSVEASLNRATSFIIERASITSLGHSDGRFAAPYHIGEVFSR